MKKNFKLKNRNQQHKFISQINLVNNINYNLFKYYLKSMGISLNRKSASQLFVKEFGFYFSLKNLLILFYKTY